MGETKQVAKALLAVADVIRKDAANADAHTQGRPESSFGSGAIHQAELDASMLETISAALTAGTLTVSDLCEKSADWKPTASPVEMSADLLKRAGVGFVG